MPVRWVLVRDPTGAFEPQAFLCMDQAADPLTILRLFIRRWSVELTFADDLSPPLWSVGGLG